MYHRQMTFSLESRPRHSPYSKSRYPPVAKKKKKINKENDTRRRLRATFIAAKPPRYRTICPETRRS